MTKRSVIRITKNLQGLAVSEEKHDEFVKNDASAIKKPSISKPQFLIPVSGFRCCIFFNGTDLCKCMKW